MDDIDKDEDIMFVVMLIHYWKRTEWKYNGVKTSPLPRNVNSINGSIGFLEIFDDLDKALETANGDISLIMPITKGEQGANTRHV